MKKLTTILFGLLFATSLHAQTLGEMPQLPTGIANLSGGIYSATNVAPGTGYVPGDTITIAGGTTNTLWSYLGSAILVVTDTKVVSATVAAAGSSCTNGASQTVTGTTGTGTKFQALVTVSGNAITAVNSISVAGDYTVNPTVLTVEPVTGVSCSGSQLNVVMGVLYAVIQNQGNYTSLPPLTPATQGSTGGTGTGATFTVLAGVNAAQAFPQQNQTQPGSAANTQTRFGFKSLNSLTTGVENTAFGWSTLAALTTGQFNTAFGTSALLSETTGNNNVAIGTDAMRNTIAAHDSIAIGVSANSLGTSSVSYNIAIGTNALKGQASSSGFKNVAIGHLAMSSGSFTSGTQNVAIGNGAGSIITSGGTNTILGNLVASTTLATGSNNVLIGTTADIDTASSSTANTIQIGAGSTAIWSATGTGTPATAATTINGTLSIPNMANASANEIVCIASSTGLLTYEPSVATCVPSAMRFKTQIDTIKPNQAVVELASLETPIYEYKDKEAFGSQPYIGLYAEQVCAMDERLCIRDKDGAVKNYDHVGMLSYLVAAVQAQQEQIAKLENRWCLGKICW